MEETLEPDRLFNWYRGLGIVKNLMIQFDLDSLVKYVLFSVRLVFGGTWVVPKWAQLVKQA